MPVGSPDRSSSPRRRSLLGNPFLWGGVAVVVVLAGILLFGASGREGTWPAALYLPEDGVTLSAPRFRAEPGGPVLELDWSSSTTSTTITGEGTVEFEGEYEVFRPARDPVRKFLGRIGPFREPTRVYATTGEIVEADGRRWFRLAPK